MAMSMTAPVPASLLKTIVFYNRTGELTRVHRALMQREDCVEVNVSDRAESVTLSSLTKE
jgi:hypothetical protein